jgi:hypothetical protein
VRTAGRTAGSGLIFLCPNDREYNTKTKQLSSNMAYYAVKLVFDKNGALDRTQTVAVKLTRDQFIKLTEKHLPKDKKTKQ